MELVLKFAKEGNADETYAQILGLDFQVEELDKLAEGYESAELEEKRFCQMVEQIITEAL